MTVIHKGQNCEFINKEPKPTVKIDAGKKRLMRFFNEPRIIGKMAVVGTKEGSGPLGEYFQKCEKYDKMKEKTFELAEIRMLDSAIKGAVADAKLSLKDIDLLISGDLLNQNTSSHYEARDLNMAHLGVYSACSTMTEALLLGAALIDGGYFHNIVCATSSHFATAERQYRFPLEYGCQRPHYSQWTVTGAGSSVLSDTGIAPRITMAMPGRVTDFGIRDLNNMGGAMAPAAMDTMLTLFNESGIDPDDFDVLLTGDLGKLGSDILRDLMSEKGINLKQNYIDCGNMMYASDQNCYQGGSGAACSATVFNSFIMDKLISGEYKRVAYLATGALMSPQSCFQGESIPAISHAVVVESYWQ